MSEADGFHYRQNERPYVSIYIDSYRWSHLEKVTDLATYSEETVRFILNLARMQVSVPILCSPRRALVFVLFLALWSTN